MLKRSEIRKSEIFRGLSSRGMGELMGWLESLELPPERVVIQEGREPDGLFLLFEGEVEVVKRSKKGPLQLNVIEAPSFFGEISLLTDSTTSTSVHTLTDTRLGFLSHEIFLSQLAKNNSTALLITANLGKLLSRRLADSNEQMELLTSRARARERGRKFRQGNV